MGFLRRIESKLEGVFEGGIGRTFKSNVQPVELARKLAAKSPLALRGTKHVITHGRDHSVAESMEYVALWNAAMLMSEDLAEAVMAFQKKRPPTFRD